MSWYREKVYLSDNPGLKKRPSFDRSVTFDKNISISIPITNIKDEADKDRLVSSLQMLEGINRASVSSSNRLNVNFNIAKTSLQAIVSTVAKLGFHYIQRG